MKLFFPPLLTLLLLTAACAENAAPPPPLDYANGAAPTAVDGANDAGADEDAAPPVVAVSEPTLSGMPERLVIPQLGLDTPVTELGWSTGTGVDGYVFSQWEVANNAAGWHKNSAQPGEAGNVVMSGHNNILGAVFRELDQLRKDDEITVYADDESFDYTVEQVLIVPEKRATVEQREANAQWITQTDDDRLTLVSCWPRDNNTHRIIVVAKPTLQSMSSQ